MDNYQWYPVTLGPKEEQSLNLSPVVMYNLRVVPDNLTCTGDICWSKVSLKWSSSTSCKGKLVCQNLVHNVCGNYGVMASILRANGSSLEPRSICQESGSMDFNKISRNDVIEMEYWHHHASSLEALPDNIQCYLWCTASGLEPVISQPDTFRPNLTAAILLQQSKPIQKGGLGLSPHLIYSLNESLALGSTDGELCNYGPNGGKCLTSYSLNWFHSRACLASIVCPEISGNVCGNFALGMVFKNKTASKGVTICKKNTVFKYGLAPGGQVLLYISYDQQPQPSDFKFQCYFWCTEDGLTPDISTSFDNQVSYC